MRTHYEVLGVAPSASPDEIRRAYHHRAREHHPDVQVGAGPETHQQTSMVEINAAWAVLGDSVRRRTYDRTLPLTGGAAAFPDPAAGVDDLADVLAPDPDPSPPGPADAMVLVPVALLAMAVACFAFSTMTEAPVLLLTSVILLAMAGTTFLATPLLVLRRSARRRTARRD